MQCPSCGRENSDQAKSCHYCGQVIRADPLPDWRVRVAQVGRPRAASLADYELAGFGVRLGGYLIDVVVYAAIGFVAGIVLVAAGVAENEDPPIWLISLASILLQWGFNSLGWTPGKGALGLRIVTQE